MEQIEDLIEKILEEEPSKVLVQVPEGLRKKVTDIQSRLEREGVETFVSLEPCYGACDIKDKEAKELGCDLLVHVGHTKFCDDERIKTLYFPWYYERDPVPLLKQSLDRLKGFENIGLLSTANFLPSLDKARAFLEEEGFNVFTEEGDRTAEGQILGCDVSAALAVEDKVDCYLYFGSGIFHPLGLLSETEAPVFRLDFEENEIEEMSLDRFKRQRIIAVEKAKEAKTFGILLTTKKGQSRPELASRLKEKLEASDKRAYLFTMDEVTPGKLAGIDVDCLINTACPRVAVEHRTQFGVPILNPDELEEALLGSNL
ncbi:MAG: diphthamide biosynthesis enzyme Dph2 [Candidatus Aenigmatarchaeota archaeon]